MNVETTNWRLITYNYNNKLSYTYDYNVFGIFGNPVISSPIYDSIDDLMIGLENDYDRLYNRDEIVIIPKSRKDRIVKETKPFV